MTAPGLFDEPPRVEGTADPAERTAGERMRDRHLAAIARGSHPLALALGYPLPLHPGARRDGVREHDGTPRCGGCVHRQVVATNGNRSWPKCLAEPRTVRRPASTVEVRLGRPEPVEYVDYPRVTHGYGTDVAAWWPACRDHTPRE